MVVVAVVVVVGRRGGAVSVFSTSVLAALQLYSVKHSGETYKCDVFHGPYFSGHVTGGTEGKGVSGGRKLMGCHEGQTRK